MCCIKCCKIQNVIKNGISIGYVKLMRLYNKVQQNRLTAAKNINEGANLKREYKEISFELKFLI